MSDQNITVKPKIKEAVIVEGRYDKNTLSQIIDGLIVAVNGFNIFHNLEIREYIKNLAEKNGIVVMTDSDSAGFMIRNTIRGFIPGNQIKDAYIPDIYGKEKRKDKAGKEGKLGVEGMNRSVILQALQDAGVSFEKINEKPSAYREFYLSDKESLITGADLYHVGLSGKPNSAQYRAKLLLLLGLPEHMNTNDLIRYLNRTMNKNDFLNLTDKIMKEGD